MSTATIANAHRDISLELRRSLIDIETAIADVKKHAEELGLDSWLKLRDSNGEYYTMRLLELRIQTLAALKS